MADNDAPLPQSSLRKDWRPGDELDGIPIDTAERERIRAKAWMNTAGEYARNADYWREQCEKRATGIVDLSAREVTLACPACGDEYVHHNIVTVRSRPREDGPGVRTVIDSAGELERHELSADSPEWSGRRDEVAIRLWCENCAVHSILRIVQHKGVTLLSAVRVPDDEERVITYCSFAGGEPEHCLGILVLTGAHNPEEASRQAWSMGLNPGGQLLAVVGRETDADLPPDEFEAYWANRDRLISLEEAKQLFSGIKSIREHEEEGA